MVVPNRSRSQTCSLDSRLRKLSKNLRLGILAVLSVSPGFGCGREFFREWADQDVTEAVFEKTRDPRWNMPLFTIDPPAMSRYADYSDPDRPPAPPDDHATEALSPYPQKPHMRLLVPMEGTGYLDMLEQGPRYEAPPEERKPGDAATTDLPPRETDTPPGGNRPPAAGGTSPFAPGNENNIELPNNDTSNPNALPGNSLPALPGTTPAGESVPRPAGNALPTENPGPGSPPITPNNGNPPSNSPATSTPGTGTRPSAARRTVRDPNLIAATFQVPETRPTQPGVLPDVEGRIQQRPGSGDITRPEEIPGAERPFNLGPNATPGQVQAVEEEVSDFAATLSAVQIEVSQATAAGLPSNSRPYVVNPATALQLSLVNNRNYQFALENVYIQSLAVTLARFRFEPQFYAGMSPTTAPNPAGFPFTGNGNQFVYRTKATGLQTSQLTLSEAAGFGKLLTFGGRLAAGFASSTVFNFIGSKPQQPVVSSSLPLSFVQPFLQGGGRAVTLEPLTQAERTLIYEVRNFARSRQQFFVNILTSNQPGGVAGTTEPSIGFLNVLSLYMQAENQRITVASFQRALEIFTEYAKNSSASGVSPLQVDQTALQYRQAQIQLIQAQQNYRNALDSYKQQLGMPPDTPLILDMNVIADFRMVLRNLLKWQQRRGHDPRELPSIIADLPNLELIVLDDRPLFEYEPDKDGQPLLTARYSDPEKLEEFLLVGERIALENRLDLMNQRATLYDTWRQLEVTANALLPAFNVSLNYQLITPSSTTNPFGFNSQSNQTSLSYNFDLPLNRYSQRNDFRTSLLNYQRGRRALMSLEDTIKNQIRQDIRNLIFFSESYEITKTQLINGLRQRDQSLQQLIAPPAQGNADVANVAIQTNNFLQSITTVLGQLNSLITNWVSYQTGRLALYRDLGIMPYDEWEAYYELFPASASDNASQPRAGQPAAAPNVNNVAQPPQGRGA